MKKILILISIILFSCNQKGVTLNYKNKAPLFSLPNTKKEIVALSDFKGKVVLIDFWASWCSPCRRANKKLVTLYEKYKSDNFEILGVSLDGMRNQKNAREDWLDGIKEDNLTWTNVSELNGWSSEVVDLYNIRSIPHAVLLDKEGNIIAEKISINTLEKELENILHENQN